MKQEDILHLRDSAEQTRVQFKERVTRDNKYDVCCEMVAQSNTRGGTIVIGIDDKSGRINALSFKEAQETTNLLGGLASESVVPQILLDIENVQFDNGIVVVATIREGRNKPYRDSKGIIWVKQGADKRKVFDNAELVSMLMENGQVHPDSMPITGAGLADLDEDIVKDYLLKRFRNDFDRLELSVTGLQHSTLGEISAMINQTPERIFKNYGLVLPDGRLTLAALMLMGKYPQRWLPAFTARCVSFVGNSIGGTEFRDKSGGDADGNVVHLYRYIMSFLTRNLRHKQVDKDFNSTGELEVPVASLSELVVNALLHRSYVIEAPLRVFIFDNRIEIRSPGLLPEGVSIENITQGVSVPRNKLLFNHAIHLLPYTGAGSGITRALQFAPNIRFENNEMLNEFVIVISRESDLKEMKSAQESVYESVQESVYENILTTCHKELLTKSQKDIINFCSVPRTAQEILDRLGLSHHSANRRRHIMTLVKMGLLEMTIPNNPKDKNQKYRKVR